MSKQNTYRCTIEIDVEATSHEKAAREAYRLMWSPNHMRPVVGVVKWKSDKSVNSDGTEPVKPKRSKRIDLNELPDGQFPMDAVGLLRDFIRAYCNPGESMDWEIMNDIYQQAIELTGLTEAQIEKEREEHGD